MCGHNNLIKLLEDAKLAQLSQSSADIEDMSGNQMVNNVNIY